MDVPTTVVAVRMMPAHELHLPVAGAINPFPTKVVPPAPNPPFTSNSQFEFLGRVERELDVEALEHEGEEMRPAGKTQIARERPQIIKEGLTAH